MKSAKMAAAAIVLSTRRSDDEGDHRDADRLGQHPRGALHSGRIWWRPVDLGRVRLRTLPPDEEHPWSRQVENLLQRSGAHPSLRDGLLGRRSAFSGSRQFMRAALA